MSSSVFSRQQVSLPQELRKIYKEQQADQSSQAAAATNTSRRYTAQANVQCCQAHSIWY